MRELAEIRAALVETEGLPHGTTNLGNGADTDSDFAPDALIEISTASERWNRPRDTLRLWCRQGDGKKVGGRWLVSAPRLRRRLNGALPMASGIVTT